MPGDTHIYIYVNIIWGTNYKPTTLTVTIEKIERVQLKVTSPISGLLDKMEAIAHCVPHRYWLAASKGRTVSADYSQ